MVSQNVKMQAPSSLNGNPTSKKMVKWLLGRSRGVKMVAKIISHDDSEEKGPAAEGVALKIMKTNKSIATRDKKIKLETRRGSGEGDEALEACA